MKKILSMFIGVVLSATMLSAYSEKEVKSYFMEGESINQDFNMKSVVDEFLTEQRKSGISEGNLSMKLLGAMMTPGTFLADRFELGAGYKFEQLAKQMKFRVKTKDEGFYLWKNEFFLVRYSTFFSPEDQVFKDFIKEENGKVRKFMPLRDKESFIREYYEVVDYYSGLNNFLGYLQKKDIDTKDYFKLEVIKIKEKQTNTYEDDKGSFISMPLKTALKISNKDMKHKHLYNTTSAIMSGEEFDRLKIYMEDNKKYFKFNMMRKLNCIYVYSQPLRHLRYQMTTGPDIALEDIKVLSPKDVIDSLVNNEDLKFYLNNK